ncbi:PAS domain-containing protein [Daejeonella lutea]|uniref:PAS domain S-box-containing protein n=1 Tax=Daejeonella lutea TaxID=572036 RepID=A0A1T5EHD0_9SPHI|nr:PAS domain-containing protein [Daejeonella lutea]SKB83306.1 PAS domain S-box-containing protein [Daejeonella lutea]
MRLRSLWIPIIFLLLGFFWALTSEPLVNFLYSNYTSVSESTIRTLNRLYFVIITGILLFYLIWRQQRKRERSDQQYRDLFFANPNPMGIYELESLQIIEVNNAAINKYGYTRSEFLNMSIMDIRSGEQETLVKSIDFVESQIADDQVWEHRLKSGELITVSVASHRLTFNGKKCNMVMITDITPIIRAKQQLETAYRVEKQLNKELDHNLKLIERSHEDSRKMGEVIDKVSNLIIIFGPDDTISWVNKAFIDFTGYSLEECVGKNPGKLLTGPATSPKTLATLIQALTIRKFVTTDIINYKKDGTPYWAELNISPIFDRNGEFEFFISIETVITDRMEKQERLDRQYQAFREIAWTNSHETRKPLATLLSVVDLMKHAVSEAERIEYTAIIEQCSLELDEIIRDSALKINNLEDEMNPASEKEVKIDT